MANTYTQLYIHIVFAVRYRRAVIDETWEERLHKYITGIVQNNGHKMLAINSAYDHIHIFIGYSPSQSLSELMKAVKGESSEFVNKEGFCKQRFHWQAGYGAFSYSRSHIDSVVKYIINQKEHHKRKTFRKEYLKMLKDYDVPYDERYVFKDLED